MPSIRKAHASLHLPLPATPEPPESFYTAVIVWNLTGGQDEEIVEQAKAAIATALAEDIIMVEVLDSTIVAGNRKGIDYAISRDTCHKLQSQIDQMKERLDSVEKSNMVLELRTSHLERNNRDYTTFRNCFLSTFKRDKLGTATKKDLDLISAGNQVVHGGNCLCDAELYELGQRRDFTVYQALYGLNPTVVKSISYAPMIAALNLHASDVSSAFTKTSPEYEKCFHEFITAVENSDNEYRWQEHPDSQVSQAYWKFINARRTGIRECKGTADT
ncbi:uncharacterized protein BJX67DRAFT_363288 [Aspergillus lucknowensis]|uniref:Uncharacterized protein n=1 Tax=Aspergillus lucknowensis TaxID=176173 RepID=A0ABR4LG88_9EURO